MPKKRRGPMKIDLIDRLTREANEYHREVRKHHQGMLEYARKCGEALNRIRWETDHWKIGGWIKWIKDHFEGSYETAKVYIRIHKKWEDPRLVEARKKGINIDSIKKVLDILKGIPLQIRNEEFQSKSLYEKWVLMARDQIRKDFAEFLRELALEELETLEEYSCEDGWDYFYKKIYNDTCGILETDLNEIYDNLGWLKNPSPVIIPNRAARLAQVEEMRETEKWVRERVRERLNKNRKP